MAQPCSPTVAATQLMYAACSGSRPEQSASAAWPGHSGRLLRPERRLGRFMASRYAGGLTFQVTATIRSCARYAAGAVVGLGDGAGGTGAPGGAGGATGPSAARGRRDRAGQTTTARVTSAGASRAQP